MSLLEKKKFIIGVIYLPPCLGYSKHQSISSMIDSVQVDLHILEKCGVDGALLENENDHPYLIKATPEVISSFSVVAHETVKSCENRDISIGVEFLINDPVASLSIAKASGASFIRTDYFVDRMYREEFGGEMEIDPASLMEYRQNIKAKSIKVFTDIQVKYARMLENKTLTQSAKEAEDARSDGVIVSGDLTGIAPTQENLLDVKQGIQKIPVIVGSGLSAENAKKLFIHADGAIVGTSIMNNGRMSYEKVARLMDVVREIREDPNNR